MKNLITIIVIMFAFGCGKSEIETVKTEPKPLSPETSTQVLSSYAKLFGSYEVKDDGDVVKLVLLENGKSDRWLNGEKVNDGTWKIVEKEVHVVLGLETAVFKVKPNGDLTWIAYILEGEKRTDEPKEDQFTFKKLKE